MEEGIYVDREFCYDTEKDRRMLRPFLKAAKNLPEYKKKCRLERNSLVLDGKRYNKENLHQLPKKLDPMNVATKSTDEAIGFFGELCPLSNFHSIPFLYNEVYYHSSEQMIQHMKAKTFGDKVLERQILNAKIRIECKLLSKDISNFSFKTWSKKAKEMCKKGLEAKFTQNPRAMQALLETGQKKLVECTYDSLWGNCTNQAVSTNISEKTRGSLVKYCRKSGKPILTEPGYSYRPSTPGFTKDHQTSRTQHNSKLSQHPMPLL